MEGYGRFPRVIQDAPPLRSRPPLPRLIAGQLAWIHHTVFVAVGRETVAGRNPDEVSRDRLVLLDGTEELLGEKVLNYAVRGER